MTPDFWTERKGVRVALSSGDVFWLDCTLDDAQYALNCGALQDLALMNVADRVINPRQIAQLTYEPVPSIETPHPLKEVAAHDVVD